MIRRCTNRVVAKGINYQLEVFRVKSKNGELTWGVRTLEFIPDGSFICEVIGQLIEPGDFDSVFNTHSWDQVVASVIPRNFCVSQSPITSKIIFAIPLF